MTANPYDQFDNEQVDTRRLPPSTGTNRPVVEANPYDQFDDPDLYGPPTNPDNVPRNYTFWEALQSAPGSWPDSAAKLVQDMAHAFTNPQESLPALWDLIQAAAAVNPGNIAGNPGTPGIGADDMQGWEKLAEDYKGTYGNWEAFKRTLAEDPVRLTTDAMMFFPGGSLAHWTAGSSRLARGAATVGDALLNPLTLAEPIAKGAGHGVRAVANHLTISPEARTLYRATEGTGGQQKHAVAALESNHKIVKGSYPDAATATVQHLPLPDLHGLQEKANKLASAANELRLQKNADARVNALREHGGTAAQLDAAKQARSDAAKQDYAAAGVYRDPREAGQYPVEQVTHRVDNNLKALIDDRPSVKRAMTKARRGSADAGVPFQIGETKDGYLIPGRPTSDRVVSDEVFNDLQSNQPIHQDVEPKAGRYLEVPEQRARLYADGLHRTKLILDEMAFEQRAKGGAAAQSANDTAAARHALVNWLRENNPEYAAAMDNFKAKSKRINEMEIIQELEKVLKNPTLGDETTHHLADAYSRAVKNAPNIDALIRRATGTSYVKSLEDGVSPEALKAINDVQSDLSRDKMAAELRKKANPKVANSINTMVTPVQAPNMLNIITSAGNYLSRVLSGQLGEQAAKNLANAMQTPEGAAAILRSAIEQHDTLDARSTPLHIGGKTVATFNRRGAPVYNALREQEESKRK
jgi:hypothetical protein